MAPPAPTKDPAPAEARKPSKAQIFARRLRTTIALWAVVAAALWFQSGTIFFGLLAFFSLAGLREFGRMLAHNDPGYRPYHLWSMALATAYLTVKFVWIRQFNEDAPFLLDTLALAILLQVATVLSYREGPQGTITLFRLFGAVFGFLYAILLFAFLNRVLYLDGIAEDGKVRGVFLVLYVLAVTKFTDMGAYAIGSLIGTHKMVPHISPGKTWQGLGGALLGALVASLGLLALFPDQLQPITWLHALILAPILTAVATAGDLAESILKRCLAVKDSGHTLPGIGGVLDLTDSLLFTAPVFYLYLWLIATL
jgi:phosphatidate cytidylyltransferase